MLIVIALSIALATKLGIGSRSKIVANSTLISAASSAVSAAAIFITALLAYFKFFRGRTFANRVVLTVDVTVLTGPDGNSLHTLVAKADNVGTVPIWDPKVQVEIIERNGAGSLPARAIEGKCQLTGVPDPERGRIGVLESGETANFSFQDMISQKVWAVTYLITLRSVRGDAWSTVHAVMAHNAESHPASKTHLWSRQNKSLPRVRPNWRLPNLPPVKRSSADCHQAKARSRSASGLYLRPYVGAWFLDD
jgi:hypothetical protein